MMFSRKVFCGATSPRRPPGIPRRRRAHMPARGPAHAARRTPLPAALQHAPARSVSGDGFSDRGSAECRLDAENFLLVSRDDRSV